MKFIAALDADLDNTPLGTRSRLAELLSDRAVVRRTVDRLLQCERLAEVIMLHPPEQGDRLRKLLGDAAVTLRARSKPAPPYRPLVQTARKWSLDAWRGGLGGATSFDEYTDTTLLGSLAADHEAAAVVVVPPGAALVDPKLTDAMIEHFEKTADEMRMTFAQAPPGLTPVIFQGELLRQLAQNHVPPGWTLAYKPDDPQLDLAMKTCCYHGPQALRHATGRLTADTGRSLETMRAMVAAGVDGSAESIGRWLIDRELSDPGRLPREVEIELTTEDPLPGAITRPRGDRVPRRGPLHPDIVDRLARELAADDDALVVLAGHGDPAMHPDLRGVLRRLRKQGVYGIALYTTGQQLSDEAIAAIVEHRVDTVLFQVDAWTAETYECVAGGAVLRRVTDAIDRLAKARAAARQIEPIIVPQITKCSDNVGELDTFFDGWLRAQGCATIGGYSHFGGRLPDRRVVDMSPPKRCPCRRMWRRCMVLADGTVAACDQDYAADMPIGHLGNQTLAQVWRGAEATRLRAAHAAGDWNAGVHCGLCAEWHRP